MFRKLPWLFSIVSFALILIVSSPIKYVLNVPSAIVAVVLPIFILLAVFSAADIRQAFKDLFSPADAGQSAFQLRKSSQVFVTYGILSLALGIIASMFSVVAILGNLSTPEDLPVNFSVSMITIFYALLVIVFLAYPASNALSSAARRATLIDES
ncbi:MAG: hypothetical protein KKB51_00340 [Candidatus Riflebacteria bacterium]|nr:hypothetical protein [Candidatus Riflebacteria bacterium]